MIQNCQVYINIFCDEEDKLTISSWLKDYFNKKENMNIWNIPLNYLEIVDDAKELIVLDLEVDVPCTYIDGYPGTRWDPPEPAYIEGYFEENDFIEWVQEILPDRFHIEIEIDNDSNIPNERELIRDFEEETYYKDDRY